MWWSTRRLLLDVRLEFERSIRDFNAFWRKWTDSTLWWSLAAISRTLRIRPPTVTMSALRVLRCRELRISLRSGMRSERSSQHNDALNRSLPSSDFSPESTLISSVSEGKLSSSAISNVSFLSSFTRSTTFARRDALSV